jgi:DNA-binding SARP family transcriptional activator
MALRTGMPVNRLALLRGFVLAVDGRAVDLPQNAERLLTFLALNGGTLRREYVAGSLWPEAGDGHAAASLRTAVWRIQQAAARVIDASRTRLLLAEDVAVDVREAAGLAVLMDSGAELPPTTELLGLLDSELLPDWYDDWLLPHRERWRQTRLHSLEGLALRLARAGRFAVAVDAALAAVRAEPLRESATRCLIQIHLAEGNVSEARRVLDLHRQAIRADLGIEPSPQLVALVSGTRRNDALTMR